MPIKSIRIHPAIGIARLGNSPEFFIGPERPLDRTPPAGGYKDAACQVKRQGARFRLFAFDQNGAFVKELTAADGPITWTAHLANRKAAAPAFFAPGTRNSGVADRNSLVIDGGELTLTGPNQTKFFDKGTITFPGAGPFPVPLGEMRTDGDGHLIILGGSGKSASPNGKPLAGDTFNHDNWYDDTSDGYVKATIKLPTGTFDATPAWVVCAPPKFAPPIDHTISLYDRLQQFFIDSGLLNAFNDPSPSYTKYIYPILNRARQIRGVYAVPGFVHQWADPVYDTPTRNAIFSKLTNPAGGGGDMPLLADAPAGVDPPTTLTATQYAIMKQWNDGNFTKDWTGVPTPPALITADGLDAAALENCVGAAFFPGIEAGHFLISDKNNYTAAFRLDPVKVKPGDVTAQMALPWQTDFWACQTNWWPPARPNVVMPASGPPCISWDTGVPSGADMVNKWYTLGFVVDQGGKYVDTERCPSSFVTLLTPTLNFKDVPQGPMGMSRKSVLAIEFEVESPGSAVTLQYVSGPTHPRLQRLGGSSVTVGPTSGIVLARLWITYETGAPGETITDSAVIKDAGSSQQWTVQILANTVARKKAVAALVLDRSGSMTQDRGDGISKIQSLRDAVGVFVDVMLQDDAVALVRFNQDAQLIQPVTALGSPADPFDPGRTNTKNTAGGPQLDPAGQTSIGDGIDQGRQALNAAAGYDLKSLVVLTDGVENRSLFISDVSAEIDSTTYGIGLGKPENISATALQTISGNSGGYLLVTGAITGDNKFLLEKYFLQILAGISNAEVVLDPQGVLTPGVVHRIPFPITEADAGMDVILLSPFPRSIRFLLQSPSGFTLDASNVAAHSGVVFVQSSGVSYYRMRLPFEYLPNRFDAAGLWTAILELQRSDLPGLAAPSIAGLGTTLLASASNAPAVAANAPFRLMNVAPPANFPEMRATSLAGSLAAVNRIEIPYSLIVHTYSEIRLKASLHQDSFAPGSTVALHGALLEFEQRLKSVQMWAEVARPGGAPFIVAMQDSGGGNFQGSFATTVTGTYAVRVRAAGKSSHGAQFRREQTLTAVARYGGDPPHPDPGNRTLCVAFDCLVHGGGLSAEYLRKLKDQGIDLERLRACICTGSQRTGDNFPDA
jgi:hypothetical protein